MTELIGLTPATARSSELRVFTDLRDESQKTDWNLDGFDNFLRRRGYKSDLYHAHICSCKNQRTRQPDYVCPLCLNRGDVLKRVGVVYIFVERMMQKTGLETSGVWELGEAKITLKRTETVDQGDSLVHTNYENRKNDIITTTGSVDRLRFNFVTTVERVSVLNDANVDRVRDLDEKINNEVAITAEKTEREIKARDLETILVEGVDFELVRVGNRSFIRYTNNRPTAGVEVSVRYRHSPEYVVIDLPMDDTDRDNNIVHQRKVRRRDLMGSDDSGEGPHASAGEEV